ncbi:MAG: peptidylprolyl isomerase [Oligosphaeraceae bacterium]
MKPRFLLLALALLCPVWCSSAEISESVLARVGDTILTSYEVRLASAAEESQLPPGLSEREHMDAVAAIRQETLEAMILQELVWLDFQALKGKIPAELVQERIDNLILTQANASEERFRDMLHGMNMTYKEFQEKITKQLAVEMLLYDRTRRNLFISDAQIREYFQEHRQDFVTAPQYRVHAIQLAAGEGWEETCQEIQRRLKEGEDFGALAIQFSQGPNAQQGGDLGWLETMAPALQQVVDTLAPGEVADAPLSLGNAYYIIKLADRKGGNAPTLTPELQDTIRKLLEEQTAAQRLEEYKKTLVTKYPLRRY